MTVTTVKLLQDVSRIRATSVRSGDALSQIADLTLRSTDGLALVVSLNKSGEKTAVPFAAYSRSSRGPDADAGAAVRRLAGKFCPRISAPLLEHGRAMGMIDLYFESAHFGDFEPQPLANFLGQQIGLMLAGSRLGRENRRLLTEVREIERELALRKVIQRARGILAVSQNATEEEAMSRMQQQSIRLSKPIAEIAESIITHQASRFTADQRNGRHRRTA